MNPDVSLNNFARQIEGECQNGEEMRLQMQKQEEE